MTLAINWDDPRERANLIKLVGIDEYNHLHEIHLRNTTIETINGYPIRAVNSRYGRIFVVGGLNRGHMTIEGAHEIARNAEPKET